MAAQPSHARGLKDSLERDGFVHLHSLLNSDQIQQLRTAAIEICDGPTVYAGDLSDEAIIRRGHFDVFNRYPQLAWLLFHPPILESLRSLLGDDFVYLPETALHDSAYGGWHKDTTSQQRAGHSFHWASDFRMVQLAVYLQDNDPTYAGGLDVVVGSHRRRDIVAEHTRGGLDRLVASALYRLTNVSYSALAQRVPSKVGDVVVFDLRLTHKATAPKRRPVPANRRKFALFMVASANDRHARSYLQFIKSRQDYLYLTGYQYRAELLADAEKANVRLLAP